MMLTHIKITSTKPADKAFNLSDGHGLFLTIQPNGSKLWKLSFRHLSKQKTLHLGLWPDVGLADARGQRDAARRLIASGPNTDMAIVQDRVVVAVSLLDLIETLRNQEGAHPVTGKESETSLEEVQPSERGEFVEHHQQPVATGLVLGMELFGETLTDLVEDKADQRLGATDVGRWHNQIKGDRMLAFDEVDDAPIGRGGDGRHGRVAIQTKSASFVSICAEPASSAFSDSLVACVKASSVQSASRGGVPLH